MTYNAMTHAVLSGRCPPFLGHNAFLRWEAYQDAAAYHDSGCGSEKREELVGVDSAVALTLQLHSYTLRYNSYGGEGSQESVSLTVYV